ncbi:DUF5710 domain-containing protein [Pseudomonas syringae pv. syringae]|uniref:LPD7 domain-containing protein n=1 Tax=Pseudomonas syringae TaxID=317 RepID=UPI00200B71B6|nr:LPD7 domain-containing protein [Pseudomonas syringae]MCK9759921.1 DUF5710 domain-containing protein [Pseudomonas syringae pv. syringae]MCK9774912.1 DUF5710 domain-containing protein [Pseudomonas syringae pv. syringae]
MKTSEYVVWLAVPFEERANLTSAAARLPDGSLSVEYDKDAKLWFAKPGCDLDLITKWLPDQSVRASGGGDAAAQFLDVLVQGGLIIKGMPIMDGTKQRVKTVEDKNGKKSGLYRGFLDRRPGGFFINHHRSNNAKDVTNWTAEGGEYDPVASLHIRACARQSQDDSAREREVNFAAKSAEAKRLYDRLPKADSAHAYLIRKGITPTEEIRQTSNGALVIPFFDVGGNFKTLQYIPADGQKLLFKEAPKQRSFLVVGGELKQGSPLIYAEGYATARSLNMATNLPIVMTIDAGNMAEVAKVLKQTFPSSQHFFMADFDHAKKENKGLIMATAAAAEVKGEVLYPRFNAEEINQKYTDFNDLHHSRGLSAVREQTSPLLQKYLEVPTVPDNKSPDNQPGISLPAAPTNTASEAQTAVGTDQKLADAPKPVKPKRATKPKESTNDRKEPAPAKRTTRKKSDQAAQTAAASQNAPAGASPSDVPVVADNQPSGPDRLNLVHNGEPITFTLPDYKPNDQPAVQATATDATVSPAPAIPNFTFNGQPASLGLDMPDFVPQSATSMGAFDAATSTEQKPGSVVSPGSDLANTQIQPVDPVLAADPASSAQHSGQSNASGQVLIADDLLRPAGTERNAAASSAASEQPGISGPDSGNVADTKALPAHQFAEQAPVSDELTAPTQPLFNAAPPLGPPAAEINAEAPPVSNAQDSADTKSRKRASENDHTAEVEVDGIWVGPRKGVDEALPAPSRIDKDALIARITEEMQGDNSVLYKLDGEPAFVDRGSRLDMVPGASADDEKVVAALLTAARFYRGRIELTGSDAFKAKAIDLIVQHQINVEMKNPAQQLMLEQARRAQNLPNVAPDAVHGNAPPPFDPDVPLHGSPKRGSAASQPANAPSTSNPTDAAPMAGQAESIPSAPKNHPATGELITPVSQPGRQNQEQPSPAAPALIDPAVHQVSKAAENGVVGKIMSCGNAPFKFQEGNTESIYIKMKTAQGVQTFWGKELAGLLRDTRIQPGKMVTLQWMGQKDVTVKAPVKDAEGKVIRFEDRSAFRNQWEMRLHTGDKVRSGSDEGVKLSAYDASRFAMIQHSVVAQLQVPIDTPTVPAGGLFWMTPNGQGSAKAGDELSTARPDVDANVAGQRVMSAWTQDGHLDMALFRGDGPYLQGVVRHEGQYQHVLVSLPGRKDAPAMVFNAINEQGGLIPIGVGNAINLSGGVPVSRENIAYKLEGDAAPRIGKLDKPADVPPQLHARLGFDERWKDDNSLPKSSPAAAPAAKPSEHRPS